MWARLVGEIYIYCKGYTFRQIVLQTFRKRFGTKVSKAGKYIIQDCRSVAVEENVK